uniref:Reverse transcriptase domain-containing protein n=1 Tax=Tanacetum cinerariifolium TaxID=118510 RepID=A0A6L2N7H6_TANCI|nr:hypothetical protein [Tanacetum cinerariifolium]
MSSLEAPECFDIKTDLKEIEYLLHHDPIKDIDSSLKDSIDQSNLVNLNDNFVDSMLEMFTDEYALDYSPPSLFDEYDDDLFEVESDIKNVYDDHFDSKGEKIRESKLLIDELDLPCDYLPPFEYDSFLSEDFSIVNALPLTNNEDKLAISNASLMPEDFDPPLYELPFFKEVPRLSVWYAAIIDILITLLPEPNVLTTWSQNPSRTFDVQVTFVKWHNPVDSLSSKYSILLNIPSVHVKSHRHPFGK